jgi:hypothetical protein
MTQKITSLVKSLFAPFELKPIEITSPPSELPPAFVGLLLRKRPIETYINYLATIFHLCVRGIIVIEPQSDNNNFIIKKTESGKQYGFETTLTDLITYDGVNINTLNKQFFALAYQFQSRMMNEAIQYGLFNKSISNRNMTETGSQQSILWKDFYRFIEYATFNQGMAEPKIKEWDKYLPYAAEFMFARGWIKMFASLNAPIPKWLNVGNSANLTNNNSRETLNSIKVLLIKFGDKITDSSFNW